MLNIPLGSQKTFCSTLLIFLITKFTLHVYTVVGTHYGADTATNLEEQNVNLLPDHARNVCTETNTTGSAGKHIPSNPDKCLETATNYLTQNGLVSKQTICT